MNKIEESSRDEEGEEDAHGLGGRSHSIVALSLKCGRKAIGDVYLRYTEYLYSLKEMDSPQKRKVSAEMVGPADNSNSGASQSGKAGGRVGQNSSRWSRAAKEMSQKERASLLASSK